MWAELWKRICDKAAGLEDGDWVTDRLRDLESDIDDELTAQEEREEEEEDQEEEGDEDLEVNPGYSEDCNCSDCRATRERLAAKQVSKGQWVVGEGGMKRWVGPEGKKEEEGRAREDAPESTQAGIDRSPGVFSGYSDNGDFIPDEWTQRNACNMSGFVRVPGGWARVKKV